MRERHLILMERDAKRFKVYNSKTGKCIPEYPSGKTNGLTGSFIAADYVDLGPGKQYIATTNSNTSINLWETTNYTLRGNMNLIDIQLCVKWCGHGINKLFTAGVDYWQMHAFDVE